MTTGSDRPLRICLASMAPFLGGAEVAAERLAVGLRDAGHEVLVVLGRTGETYDRMLAAKLRCVVSPMRFTGKWSYPLYWQARRRMINILATEKPDIVHSNDLPTHQMVSDAARTLKLKRICHHRFPFSGSAIDWLNKFDADRHVFVSRALMDEMCGESDRLYSQPRAVLYDGLTIPPMPTTSDRATARAKLGLPTEKVIVLIAGQVIERKGVADLIRAWSLLSAEVRDRAELVVVGDDLNGNGAYRVEMERLTGELKCRVRFAGFQRNVPVWLTAVDVAAVPSHVEPLGNATLEAMSYGRPVIGSDVGGIPEMVVHEETGLLVKPKAPADLATAVSRLVLDPAERERFGRAGRLRCDAFFSLDAHTRAAVAEYSHLL